MSLPEKSNVILGEMSFVVTSNVMEGVRYAII